MPIRSIRAALTTLVVCALAMGLGSACTSVYYDAWERVGYEKRHILASRVEDGREEQQEVQEQFKTTLDAFQALTGFDGGDLEDGYRTLQGEYDESEERAQAVRDRIGSSEQVAGDLFAEWETEIGQITEASLRARSQQRLSETRQSYSRLISAMQRAASRMDPVLTAFRNRVLALKHDLNASAIASLQGDLGEIQTDVDQLVAEMNDAIAEADSFLAQIDS